MCACTRCPVPLPLSPTDQTVGRPKLPLNFTELISALTVLSALFQVVFTFTYH